MSPAKLQNQCIKEGAVIDEETGKAMEYHDLITSEKYRAVWIKAMVKELDQLTQGKCGQKGTDTIKFFKNMKSQADAKQHTHKL
eukprot:8027043-Ditylum_brightwellii.AAC.1